MAENARERQAHRVKDSDEIVRAACERYIEALAVDAPPSLQRRRDAWKAMRGFWEKVDPTLIDEAICRSYRAKRQVADATARSSCSSYRPL